MGHTCNAGWEEGQSASCSNGGLTPATCVDKITCTDTRCQFGDCIEGTGVDHTCSCHAGYEIHNGVCDNPKDNTIELRMVGNNVKVVMYNNGRTESPSINPSIELCAYTEYYISLYNSAGKSLSIDGQTLQNYRTILINSAPATISYGNGNFIVSDCNQINQKKASLIKKAKNMKGDFDDMQDIDRVDEDGDTLLMQTSDVQNSKSLREIIEKSSIIKRNGADTTKRGRRQKTFFQLVKERFVSNQRSSKIKKETKELAKSTFKGVKRNQPLPNGISLGTLITDEDYLNKEQEIANALNADPTSGYTDLDASQIHIHRSRRRRLLQGGYDIYEDCESNPPCECNGWLDGTTCNLFTQCIESEYLSNKGDAN